MPRSDMLPRPSRSPLRLAFAVLATLPLLLSVAAAGCGDEPDPTLRDYVEAIEKASRPLERQTQNALDGYADALAAATTDEDKTDALQDFIRALQKAENEAADALEGIRAPVEASEAHEEAVAAHVAMAEFLGDVLGEARRAETGAEVDALTLDYQARVAPLRNRNQAACIALQRIADNNGIRIDLVCGP